MVISLFSKMHQVHLMQKKIKEKIKFLKFCILDENLEIHREIYLYLYIYIYHKRMAGCISLEE